MTSARTLCFIGFQILCIILSLCLLGLYLRKLREFESDVEAYEVSQALIEPQSTADDGEGLKDEFRILPKREKKEPAETREM